MSRGKLKSLAENISRVIIGKEEVTELLLTALLARGHCLIDDVPGVGKTKLANSLARSLGLEFKRISLRRICSQQTLPASISTIKKRVSFSSVQDRSLPIFSWQTKSTVLSPGPKAAFWKPWKNSRSASKGQFSAWQAPF